MPTIDQIIIGFVFALLLIVSIRLIMLRRLTKKNHSDSQPENSQSEAVQATHNWPKAFEPPKKAAVSQEDSTGAQKMSESLANVSVPNENVPSAAVADKEGSVNKEPSQTSGGPDQMPPVKLASAEELIAIMGNFSKPVSERLEAIKRATELHLREAVPVLVEMLYEPDMGLSIAAADALGKLGDSRAIEPLMEITRRNDARLMQDMKSLGVVEPSHEEGVLGASERRNAETDAPSPNDLLPVANPFKYRELTVFKIDLLPKEYFQEDGSPIPRRELVLKGLKDNDQQLRKMAAKAAIGLNDPDVIPALVDTLSNTYEVESVRYLAAEALGESGDERGADALLNALQDENVAVRYSAAVALSKMGGNKTIDALIKALDDSNEFVRSSVAYALGKIGDKEAVEALLEKADDNSEVVRFSVGKALGNLADEGILDELERRLEAASADVRRALVDVVSQIKSDKSIELLRKALRDEDSETSFKASMAVMNLEDMSLLDDLIEASKKLDNELMQWLQNAESKGALFKKHDADNDSSEGKEGSMELFNKIFNGDDSAVSGKLEAALKHESPNVRGCAANALGDFDDEFTAKLLVEALLDKHEYVRSSAVSAIGKRQIEEAVPALLKLVDDKSDEVRYALAKALANFGQNPEIIYALYKMGESDISRDVKRAAKMSLEKLQKESEHSETH